MKNILNTLMTAAVLAAGIAGMSTSVKAADNTNPVARLLAGAQTSASLISADWKAYARQTNLNKTSDAAEIARMKEDISAAVKTISTLNDSRSQASPSQVVTIDRIVPVMEELVDNAMDALEFLNTNESRLTSKESRENLSANSDTSNRLAGLIAQMVELGSGRDKFESAKRMLLLSEK